MSVAIAEGYTTDNKCVTAEMLGHPAAFGTMGLHLVRRDMLGLSPKPSPAGGTRVSGTGTHTEFRNPAMLVYEPQADGSLQLVAVENLGTDGAANGPIAVVDLSLVPSEVIHVVVAVLGRLVFEALQRYRRFGDEHLPLPTTLVLEEAHTFVRRGANDEGPAENPSQLCRETFERIAREGRKFGLGLVLSSQRPSELSPTILAQCNTFLLHRIVNDLDQGLVCKLVPDNVAGLLKELPSLPSRHAILLGWATPIPLLVEMNELADAHRPQSSDPDFWNVWTGHSPRPIDWHSLVEDWTGTPAPMGDAVTGDDFPDDGAGNAQEPAN